MVRSSVITLVLALALALVSACGKDSEAPPPDVPASTSSPAAEVPSMSAPDDTTTSASPDVPAPADTLSASELRGLVHPGLRAAVEDLRQRVTGELDQVRIVRADSATWSNASLGCPDPEKMYAQALTEGIWLVLSLRGQEYDYRIAGSEATLCTQSQQTDAVERKALPGIWTTLARVATPRSEVATVELDDKVYVFGGFGPGSTANEVYDPTTDTWKKLAPIPTPVNHAGAVAVDGAIYLIGGFGPRFQPVGTVWAYDPTTDAWARKADLPTIRGALAVAVFDGDIYAIGGRGPDRDVGATEVYDPGTDTWTSRSAMPTARDHVAVSVVDGKIFVIGGRLGSFARNLGANESYPPQTDSWRRLSPLPTVRSGIAGAAVNGRIYVFGGENVEGTFDDNERYDPLADTWETMPPMPTARHGLGSAAIGNRIYVTAGGTTPGGSQSDLNEVFIVLPEREQSTAAKPATPEAPEPSKVRDRVSIDEEAPPSGVGLIAYADTEGRVRTVRPDGSSPVTINPSEAWSGWPTWSPDGGQIAFSGILSGDEGPPGLALYVHRLEDATTRQVFVNEPGVGPILPNMPHYPMWAPDGGDLSIMAGDPRGLTLFLAQPQAGVGVDVVLRQSPLYASWSADSRHMLVHGGPDHFLVEVRDGLEVTDLGLQAGGYRAPAWWPAGERFAFVSTDEAGPGLFIADTDLDDSVRVVNVPANVAFLWSPDGSLLAVAHSDIQGGLLYKGVALFDPDGTRSPVEIPEDVVAFFWSPDSAKLAYVTLTGEGGGRRWNVLDVRDGSKWPLVEFLPSGPQITVFQFFDQFAYSHNMWSPDSGSLVFSGNLLDIAIEASFGRQTVPSIIVTEAVPNPLVEPIADGFVAVWSPK